MALAAVEITDYHIEKGNQVNFSGTVSFGDAGAGSLEYFLDPQPTGAPLGPFALTPDNGTFSKTAFPLGNGRWRIRVVVTPTQGAIATSLTLPLTIVRAYSRIVLPDDDGVTVASPPRKGIVFTSSQLRDAYLAVVTGPGPNKRVLAAEAVRDMLGDKSRLDIFRNTQLVARIRHNGAFVVADGADVTLSPPANITSNVLLTADLSVDEWWFEIQGGPYFQHSFRGTVGAEGSNKDLLLSKNPKPGMGFAAQYSIKLPPSIDGL